MRNKSYFILVFILISVFCYSSDVIFRGKIEGAINIVSEEYFVGALKSAQAQGAQCLIIELDTPGGLDNSMRKIIQAILTSKVPVIIYVSPQGARAASAGTFLLYASHIAVMSPGTNLGAAHPVQMPMPGQVSPGKDEGSAAKSQEEMMRKATNDAVAYIESLARKRGRSQEWARYFVEKSTSITADKALEEGVIELIAEDFDDLLKKLDGWKIKIKDQTRELDTSNASVISFEWTAKLRFLKVITDPNIAYLLMLLGVVGLYIELSHPGGIFPGVVGALALILGLYSMSIIPVNYAGVFLIFLAFIMFLLDIHITSYGLLSIGGVISLILGATLLAKGGPAFMSISPVLIISTVIVVLVVVFAVIYIATSAHISKPKTGSEGLIGKRGRAVESFKKEGKIFVSGEYWNSVNSGDDTISKGDKVEVVGVEGLIVKIKKYKEV